MATHDTRGSLCVDEINNAVQLFNIGLKSLVQELNANFTDAKHTFIDLYQISSQGIPNQQILGIDFVFRFLILVIVLVSLPFLCYGFSLSKNIEIHNQIPRTALLMIISLVRTHTQKLEFGFGT